MTGITKPTLVETAFTRIFGVEYVEVSDAGIRVCVDNEDDRELAKSLAHVFYLEESSLEVASDGFILFVEEASFDEEDEEDESDDESFDEEDEDEEEEDKPTGRTANAIDEDGRSLRVLTTAESHKFASKIYHQMLGNEDLSRYPAFMMDLDRFFSAYKNQSPEKSKNIDVAAFMGDVTTFEEAAKEKSGRAAFLSAFMALLSKDAGVKAIEAFSSGDADGFGSAMGDVIGKLMEAMPDGSNDDPIG